MNNLVTRIEEFIKQEQLFGSRDRLLLAVSGGMDSVVLVDCIHQAGFDFGIAHANFQLRGAESERDEAFVAGLAASYKRPFIVKRFETTTYAENHRLSTQTAARELRYRWFESLLDREPEYYRYVLTAHHADDNIETMVMHFFRGTGIAGLRGMLPKQAHIVRPLLPFPKQALRDYADAQQLRWVEDSSNSADKYTRNYFRMHILPGVESVFPEARHNLQGNLLRFRETEILYRQAIELHKKKLVKSVGAEKHIPVLLLRKSLPLRTILFEILQEYNFQPAQLDDCIHLLDGENGKFVQSQTHRLIRNRSWLIIAPSADDQAGHFIIEVGQKSLSFADGKLLLEFATEEKPMQAQAPANIALVDADRVHFPMILRKWKAGDYFYPLGMKKKKKVARFLIDQKLSKTEKEKVWVLESDKRIIWIVAYRIDNRVAIVPSTKSVLKIEVRVL
ncbi:MAG TPA: tRNA lysidine(34) synthetase TilS [Puia sp.]|nr:tRNA lysidine(34) synthetase TilS [Puia sp.]